MSSKIGTSFYQAFDSPIREVRKFIRKIAKNGGNATEFFILRTWQRKYIGVNMPYKQRGYFTDDKFPGEEFPMWDLDQFDEKKWDRWRKIFAYCKKKGVIPFVRIEDYCSFKDPHSKRFYFQFASYQRKVLREKYGSKWFVNETWKQRSRLQRKVVDTLLLAGCKEYYIVPMNEANMLGNIDHDKWCYDYHKWAVDDLVNHGCPKEQIIISTMWGFDECRSLGCIMEIHGCNSDVRMNEIIATLGTDKIFPNGDGLDKFALGRRGDRRTKREPSPEQGKEMGKLIKKYNLFGHCCLNRNTENPLPADIRRAKFDVLKAIIEGYNFVS